MISSLTPVTTAVPLIGVLSLSAVKDAYDDIVSFNFKSRNLDLPFYDPIYCMFCFYEKRASLFFHPVPKDHHSGLNAFYVNEITLKAKTIYFWTKCLF